MRLRRVSQHLLERLAAELALKLPDAVLQLPDNLVAGDVIVCKRLADAAKVPEAAGREDVVCAVGPPWPGFRDDLKAQLDRMIVSHRADHGRIDPEAKKHGRDTTAAKLHNDTAYGLTGESRGGLPVVVTRKPLTSLGPGDIPKIRDSQLSRALGVATKGKEKAEFAQALEAFSTREGPYRGIRRVRLAEAINVIPIKNTEGQPYKGYKGDSNHCYEIWRLPDGKLTHHVVTTFDAHQPGGASRPHPAAKRLLRLHRNDLVALENSKFGPVIAKIEKFDANGGIEMAPHNEANVSDRYRKERDDLYIRMRAASLIAAGARRIHVDEMGHVRDPGPISARITA